MSHPSPELVVRLLAERTEVGVTVGDEVLLSRTGPVGEAELDDAITGYIQSDYGVMLGAQTAAELRLEIGSATALGDELQAEVRGRELASGLPKAIVVTSEEIRMALEEPIQAVIGLVRDALDDLPLVAVEPVRRQPPIVLTPAALRGLDRRLHEELTRDR
ncbi:MAG: rod shape-determining protein [Solirubrobacteraceae bacterium]